MKRTVLLSVIVLLALACMASAQIMGSGQQWYNGDGGIPKYTPAMDGDIEGMKANGYHLSWGPSDIYSWGDTYGYSVETNFSFDTGNGRVVVRAYDLDNNLACSEGEDPAECGLDTDIYLNYWFSWDEDAIYASGDVTDNNYDVIAAPDSPDWAFWQRDHFWMAIDLTGIGSEGATVANVHSHPMAIDEAVYSIQFHVSIDGEATEIMYGDDPDFFQGTTTDGGPTSTGYWFEAKNTWDLLYTFAPAQRANIAAGHQVRMSFIIPDPDGDDAYGQTFWGIDYTTISQGAAYWPTFTLQDELTQTAVAESSWGAIKQLY